MFRATFDEVLDAIEHLPTDQQADLIGVVRRRLAEKERQQIAQDVIEAKAEHRAGTTRTVSIDDLMNEIER